MKAYGVDGAFLWFYEKWSFCMFFILLHFSRDCMNIFFQGWSLVSIFTINGKDGAEDFDLIGEDKGEITWEICVSEEHAHEFHGLDTFDPNDEKYHVKIF